MNNTDERTVYECVATINRKSKERNFWYTETENIVVTSADINDLYIQLGKLKAQANLPEDTGCDYTEVELGVIRWLTIHSEEDVDVPQVLATPAMLEYQQRSEEKIRAREVELAATEAAKTANELAELARLQEKYRT
jgi:hypothetical protein